MPRCESTVFLQHTQCKEDAPLSCNGCNRPTCLTHMAHVDGLDLCKERCWTQYQAQQSQGDSLF